MYIYETLRNGQFKNISKHKLTRDTEITVIILIKQGKVTNIYLLINSVKNSTLLWKIIT